jgi:hypothetical protein
MLGKKIKVSFWAKWEGAIDSNLAFFQLMPYNRKTKAFLDYTIKVNKNEWALYTQEIDYPEDISADKLNFNLPLVGTIYVDIFFNIQTILVLTCIIFFSILLTNFSSQV